MLGPGEPFAVEAITAARSTIARLRTAPLGALLDQVIQTAAADAPKRGPRKAVAAATSGPRLAGEPAAADSGA